MKQSSKLCAYIKNYAVKYNLTASIFFGAMLAFLISTLDILGVAGRLTKNDLIILICSAVLIAVTIVWVILRMKRNRISTFDFLLQTAIDAMIIFLIIGKTIAKISNRVFYSTLGLLAVAVILFIVRIATFIVDDNTNEVLESKSNFTFKGYFSQFFKSFDFFTLLVILATSVLLILLGSNYKLFENLVDSSSTVRTVVYICVSLSAFGIALGVPVKIKYKKISIVDLSAFLIDIVVLALTISAHKHIRAFALLVMWAFAISLTAICMLSTNCPTETQKRARQASEELALNNEKATQDFVQEVAVDIIEEEPAKVEDTEEVEKSEYAEIINEVNYELNQVDVNIDDLIKSVNEELCPSQEEPAQEVEDIEEENVLGTQDEQEETVEEQADEDVFEIELDCEEYEQRLDRMEQSIAEILEILKNLKAMPVQTEPVEEEVIEEVAEEEEVVEEPVQEVAEEVAEEVTEEPVEEEIEEPTQEDVSEEQDDEEAVEIVDGAEGEMSFEFNDEQENLIPVKAHLSFEMKLRKASDEVKEFYNTIKNELCSYGIKPRMSKNRENFNKGRFKIARMVINGKTLKLYLSVDPLQLDNSYYHHQDVSDKKSVAHLPTMMNIRSKLAARKACEVIASICEDNVIKKKKRYVPQSYTENLTLDGFTTFEIKGLDYLIPEDKVVSKEYAEKFDSKFAIDCLDYVMQDEAPKKIICAELSLEQLANEFDDGEQISLDKLRGKLGVQVNADYLKITESAELSKKLIITANEFTQTAVKMICLAGGQAIAVKFKN